MKKEVDYLIVGQGLAGTLISFFSQKAGKTIHVIDKGHEEASSKVAAGIINPITGRRYVKSWLFETLLPFAHITYTALEDLLGVSIFTQRNILRVLFNQKEEQDFYARSGDLGYPEYMAEEPEPSDYQQAISPVYAFGEMLQSGKANLPLLIEAYRKYLSTHHQITESSINYDGFEFHEKHVIYENIQAKKVIFCEGAKAKNNPFFNYLPFGGAKGEVLIVRIPNFTPHKILKHRVFIVPLGNNLFWIGATNENQFETEAPTEKGRTYLKEKLDDLLRLPYEIVDHLAAVRPTVKGRRPFLGQHPTLDNLFIFNGLGTKGASLGPYFAHQLIEYLEGKTSLNPKVDIRQYPSTESGR